MRKSLIKAPSEESGSKPSSKSELSLQPTKPDSEGLRVTATHDTPHERVMADVAASPIYRNAIIGRSFSKGSFGISDGLTEAVETLTVTVNKIRGGDLGFAEETLVAQASALDAIFGEMARRAVSNLGENPLAFERYMRFAFKAQSQCRTTLETLATIKNPPVVYAKQANFANGHQQVNNGVPVGDAQAEKIENQQSKLLGDRHGEVE